MFHAAAQANLTNMLLCFVLFTVCTSVRQADKGDRDDNDHSSLGAEIIGHHGIVGQSFSSQIVESQELLEIQRFASILAPAGATQTAARISANLGSAADILRELAGAARKAGDAQGDRERQTYAHLLELLFQARASGARRASLAQGLLPQLAEDVRRLTNLSHMDKHELDRITDPDNFVSYFRGLARQKASLIQTQSHTDSNHPRQKVALIFSCSFGDGHRSAMGAVRSYLEAGGMRVISVDTTTDPSFKDWLHTKFGRLWYNELVLGWKLYPMQNWAEKLRDIIWGQIHSSCPSPTCNNARKDQFRASLLEWRPDLIVTVYHMELLPILEVAKDLGNVPVMHVGTDMDLKMKEVFGAQGPGPSYPRFAVAMPFPQMISMQTAQPVRPDRRFLAGYPIRSEFLLPRDAGYVARERAKLVPPTTKIVLVMSGGNGQDVPWPELLATRGIGMPIHIIVLVGRNREAATRLRRSFSNSAQLADGREVLQGRDPQVTVEVAHEPGTVNSSYISATHLALLMDMADSIITKPGGGTSSELAYRGLPAIFDATDGLLHWEDFTVRVFEKYGRGERFVDASELPDVVARSLQRPRSISLVEDPHKPGQMLDPRPRYLLEANKLIETSCDPCNLFP